MDEMTVLLDDCLASPLPVGDRVEVRAQSRCRACSSSSRFLMAEVDGGGEFTGTLGIPTVG